MDKEKEMIRIIEKLTRAMGKIEDEALSTGELSQLSVRQIYYLDIINKLDKPTVSELARELNVTKPTVTIAVNHLIDRGLIHKEQSQEDKRVFFLYPTEKGERISVAHNKAHEDFVIHLISKLTPEETKQFVRIFSKILDVKL